MINILHGVNHVKYSCYILPYSSSMLGMFMYPTSPIFLSFLLLTNSYVTGLKCPVDMNNIFRQHTTCD